MEEADRGSRRQEVQIGRRLQSPTEATSRSLDEADATKSQKDGIARVSDKFDLSTFPESHLLFVSKNLMEMIETLFNYTLI